MFRCVFLIIVFSALQVSVFGNRLSKNFKEKQTPPAFLNDTSCWADSVFNSLTNEERIAQLIMAAAYPDKDSANHEKLFELVSKYNIGGIIFFHGGPVNTVNFENKLQSLAKTHLLIGIDGEWGLSMRLDSTLQYPRQMMLGALSDDSLIYQMGCDISKQLQRMGMQTNFSPVVDINNNPDNPVINSRSFGEDKYKVTEKGLMYMQGLQDNHIIATAKHFPGHGDTETDSHLSLPVIQFPYHRLDSLELYPFRRLVNKGVSGVMIGHLDIPQIDSTGKPATLSPIIIKSLLKDSLNFKGLVFTDALNMKGVLKWGKQAQIVLQAFKAGNDILLMPDDIDKMVTILKQAADSNIISYDEINRRCKKILLAKHWVGLDRYKPVDTSNLIRDLNKPEFVLAQRKLVENSITILMNKKNILPLKNLDTLRIACVSVGSDDTSVFQKTLGLYAPVDMYSIDRDAPDSMYDCLFNEVKGYNLVIAGLLNTDMRASKRFGVKDISIEFLKKLADSTNVVLNLMANPYVLKRFVPSEKFKAIIVSYEDKDIDQELSAQLIFGGIRALGKLPVKASDEYFAGTGIQVNNTIRLKYTIPEELGINSSDLKPIDSLVEDAIKKKAIPGCVVYLAKDGKVFYNKSFGFFTYDSTRRVRNTDVYDLASITKVAATVPSMMILYDKKQINITDRLSKYLPEIGKTNKKKITIKDILAHQARLQSWVPFYLQTLKCENSMEVLISKLPYSPKSIKINETTYVNCNTRFKENILSKKQSKKFPLQVADSLFIRAEWGDSIYRQIYKSELLPKPVYHYSDLGFMLLSKAITNITKRPFDSNLDSLLYKPLGATTLGFHPLAKIKKGQIAPTENDLVFRKQLIRGYVHDPTAAMLGGVCGHAGLFANANDLGKLIQLYLNKGEYGGKRYFNETTVNLFTSRPFSKNGNRRALGFDKPEQDLSKKSPVSLMCSDLSYGHTGFTGTMAWADPQYNLVYIFLSNRVCPDASVNKLAEINLRTNIQDVVYKALNKANIKK